jgi:hypothetical protein
VRAAALTTIFGVPFSNLVLQPKAQLRAQAGLGTVELKFYSQDRWYVLLQNASTAQDKSQGHKGDFGTPHTAFQLNPWLGGDKGNNRTGKLNSWSVAAWPSGLVATLILLPESVAEVASMS